MKIIKLQHNILKDISANVKKLIIIWQSAAKPEKEGSQTISQESTFQVEWKCRTPEKDEDIVESLSKDGDFILFEKR